MAQAADTPGSNLQQLAGQSGHNLPDVYHRLRSFSPTTWFGKPAKLSALECAGKGWTNTGPDQLSCLSCGCQILCKLPLNPWSDTCKGVVEQYIQRLVDAHSPLCLLRKQLLLDQPQQRNALQEATSSSLGFPILPTQKLSSAYYARLQQLQQLDALPLVTVSTRAHLAAAAAGLDSSLLSGLAAILQHPVNLLQHEAATAVVNRGASASAGNAGVSYLPHKQVQALLALCGWQPKLLLTPDTAAHTSTPDKPASIFGVSHLVPYRRHESSRGSQAGPTGAAAAAGPAGGSTVSAACTALECELCGRRVGLWKFTRSGPFYAQQLSSKAMQALATAAAADTFNTEAQETHAGTEQLQRATDAAAGTHKARDGSAAERSKPTHTSQQQQQQQQQSSPAGAPGAAVASPEVVFSSLCATIAGGSLLTAGAAGGGRGPTGQTAGAVRACGTTPTRSSPLGQQQQQPFGATPRPAFGTPVAPGAASAGRAAGQQQTPARDSVGAVMMRGGSQLFEGLQAAPAASVFGSPPPAAAGGVLGPFGAVSAGSDWGSGCEDAAAAAAAAPVFGLQAFQVEEQRTKRRRSSAAGAEVAAAAAATASIVTMGAPVAGVCGGGAGVDGVDGVPAVQGPADSCAAPGGSGSGDAPGIITAAAAAAGDVQHGGSAATSGGRVGVRSYSKHRSGLVAAVAAATGAAGAAEEACFDPVGAHRSWCPWVQQYRPAAGVGGGSSSVGLMAAVRMGWSSSVMAVQEALMQQELEQPLQQQLPGNAGGDGGGAAAAPDSTAAVLARARQAVCLLESQQ